ncbi:MAG: hypothetical protein MRY79_03475 [Alphaproteobacteria bacterium]|nr:hypothetical protein [Alphaproteobacteria bacterium]
MAQGITRFSTSEDVAIAFYKTGKIIPNFERWVRQSEDYRAAAVARKPEKLEKELTRLQNKYNGFDPRRDLIILRSYVRLLPDKQKDADGNDIYNMTIEFLNAPNALYFPYDFLGERIAVMPYRLDQIMKPNLTPSEYKRIKEGIRLSAKNTMIIRLRPRESDLSHPHKIDGMEQWVFKTDIISLEIWDKRGNFLWEYNATDYTPPETNKLQGLFSK